ncbi:MAG: T9SS type A sorting domain-containing protein [Paludibacteraceae bacterium]|nr:T9SS type A sorting domain-containing protein [Paludibacteraceae bacterium]
MIKKFLLASTALSLVCAAQAEKEVYIIKDGKFVGDSTLFYPSSDPEDESVVITAGATAENGETMVKIKNPAKPYKSGYVAFDESVTVNLDETWMMDVEYFIPEGTVLNSANSAKREALYFDLIGDTRESFETKNAAGEDSVVVFANNPKQTEYRIAHVSIDCRMRDFFKYNEKTGLSDSTCHGLGIIRNVKKYVYSHKLMPEGLYQAGKGNLVKGMFISFFPENEAEVIGYIKNLKFYSEGTKPFYADKMSLLAGEGTIHATATSGYLRSYIDSKDGAGVIKDLKMATITTPSEMYGQAQIISDLDKKARAKLTLDRMYCDKGEQGSVDFYDVEYGFLPYLQTTAATERSTANVLIRIPVDPEVVKEKIAMAIRFGHNGGASGGKNTYADYREKSALKGLPISYRFEKGDQNEVKEATEWTQWTASFEKGGSDLVDTIPTLMAMLYGDIDATPVAKEFNYVTIRIEPNDVISTMFGDLTLTGDNNKWPRDFKRSSFSYEVSTVKYESPIVVGYTYGTGVENVVAKGAVSIYPNPASDVITVTNEGVKSVSVYSLAGSLVAVSESNTVNVASLAKGAYIVKASTENGVISGQIIKK